MQWQGRANALSPEHGVDWPVIDVVAQATRRSQNVSITEDFSMFPTEEDLSAPSVREGRLTAEKAILGRRSAVAMDGSTAISQAAFFRMLARLIPTHDGRSSRCWRLVFLGNGTRRRTGIADRAQRRCPAPSSRQLLAIRDRQSLGNRLTLERGNCPPFRTNLRMALPTRGAKVDTVESPT